MEWPQKSAKNAKREEQIENVISGQMQELMQKVPANSGVSAAFYCPSHPYVKRYYNYGRANDRAEMSEHTIICIGSTTKVFTGSLIAYLQILDKVGPLDRTLVGKHLRGSAPQVLRLTPRTPRLSFFHA